MQETIRQHYVPRTYLKHFAEYKDDRYIIGFIPRADFSISRYNETSIENLCVEKHLYTLKGATPKERMFVENLYSEAFEKHYDQVYAILTDNRKEKVFQTERELVISTVISMYYRTTFWNRNVNEMMDSILERLFSTAKAYGKDSFIMENQEVSIKNRTLQDLLEEQRAKIQPLIILSQIRQIIKLISIRSKADGIMVDKLDAGGVGFVTSDNPVVCNNISAGHIVPIDPNNMFSLPLDDRHSLTILPNKISEWRHSIYRNNYAEDVSLIVRVAVNTSQINNSERFILGSRNSMQKFFKDTEMLNNPDNQTKRLMALIEKLNEAL